MTTLEERNAQLDAARALILAGWCQRASARDDYGAVTLPELSRAVAFCAVGAVIRIARYGDAACLGRALKLALIQLGHEPRISRWNDAEGRTKEEVAGLFDLAKEQPL